MAFPNFSMQRSLPNKIIPILFLLVSFAGFADATFLTVEHYRGVIPPCSVLHGCEKVTTSAFSTIAGVPISLPGVLYYLTLFITALIFLDTGRARILRYGAFLSFAGFGVSMILVFIQLVILQAICLYCMFSALTSTILFILGLLFLKSSAHIDKNIGANSDILLDE